MNHIQRKPVPKQQVQQEAKVREGAAKQNALKQCGSNPRGQR